MGSLDLICIEAIGAKRVERDWYEKYGVEKVYCMPQIVVLFTPVHCSGVVDSMRVLRILHIL